MRFDFNDEQGEIKGTAKQFIASRFKADKVRELAEAGTYDDALWTEVSELGWPGIAVSEEYGGQGLGMVELVVLCEELGFACAPLPLLSNAAAGLAIEAAGSDEQKAAYLPGIASGEGRVAVGDSSIVLDGEGADAIVIFGDDGATIVPASDAQLEPLDLIDSTRRYSRLVSGDGDALPGELGSASNRMIVAVAAELVGIGQRAMEMAVEYAKERQQFERPIGAYQGVSHACAKMLYDVEEARSLTYSAAWAADAEPESLPMAAAMAKARASEAAWDICKASIQVHGGIGFTWEHDLHFLLKRSRADAQLFGTASQHKERVASLSGLG
jgi:alkylation response protein AidB-like acyl-CoA dehydrogenase